MLLAAPAAPPVDPTPQAIGAGSTAAAAQQLQQMQEGLERSTQAVATAGSASRAAALEAAEQYRRAEQLLAAAATFDAAPEAAAQPPQGAAGASQPASAAADGAAVAPAGTSSSGSSGGSEQAAGCGGGGACEQGVALSKEVAWMSAYLQRQVVQTGCGLPGSPPVCLPKQVRLVCGGWRVLACCEATRCVEERQAVQPLASGCALGWVCCRPPHCTLPCPAAALPQVSAAAWPLVLEYCTFHAVPGRSDKV